MVLLCVRHAVIELGKRRGEEKKGRIIFFYLSEMMT